MKSIAKIINKGKKIAIFGHIAPDFDCLGSAFSLKEFLQREKEKEVDLFFDGKIGEKDVVLFDPNQINSMEFNHKNYDLIIVVDVPNSKRLGKFGPDVLKHKNIVKIDHHFDEIGDLSKKCWVEEDSSSCSEMIYLLLNELNANITPEIATLIYAGLIADTNSFINDNTTPRSLQIASELFTKGADAFKINSLLYKSMSKKRWDLTKLVYEKAEFIKNIGIVILSLKDLKKLGSENESYSGYANTMIKIEGCDIGISMAEKNLRTVNVSFRSRFGVRVDEIARALGGGGHKQAAACVLSGSVKQVKKRVLQEVEKQLSNQSEENG